MSITEILEKYTSTESVTGEQHSAIMEYDFPSLSANLEKLLMDKAIAFAEWTRQSRYKQFSDGKEWFDEKEPGNRIGRIYTTSELYALFLTNKTKEE